MDKNKRQLIEKYADGLYDSLRKCKPINPISDTFLDISIEDAYQIQMLNVKRMLSKGIKITGKKIGLTSLPMQNMFGVDEPDYGHLFENMVCTDGKIKADTLLQPKVEAEVAFVLKEDVSGPNATVEDVLAATDYVVAALEVVDSRIIDWKIQLSDTISDNASSGKYVLGAQKIKVQDIVLPEIEMSFYKNGKFINEGKGSAVLGDPAFCVSWLANKLWQYGVILKKGEVVLSGALSAAVEAIAGDRFEAKFSSLGNVAVEFI